MNRLSVSVAGCLALVGATGWPDLVAAQSPPSLAGKTVQMVIGFGPGGGYDLWGRTVGRFIGAHLPGHPTVVPQNMPGAGSYLAAAYIYNIAPKDGTAMAIVNGDAPLGPILGDVGARFDPQKMTWLGTPTTETNVCIAEKSAKVKTYQDLLHGELIVGDAGPGTDTEIYPKALNGLLGTKFKLISGFPSSSDVFLAMERGEVQGICESLDSINDKRPTWISSGQVNVLFQGGAEPNPTVKAPFILNLAKTDDQKAAIKFLYASQGIGRPFLAPPGMTPDRVKMLQDAFAETMKDPGFIAAARQEKLELDPHDGAYLAALIQSIYATPKPLVERIKKLISD